MEEGGYLARSHPLTRGCSSFGATRSVSPFMKDSSCSEVAWKVYRAWNTVWERRRNSDLSSVMGPVPRGPLPLLLHRPHHLIDAFVDQIRPPEGDGPEQQSGPVDAVLGASQDF